MNAASVLVLLALACAAVAAVRSAWRHRGSCAGGGCCGDCARCGRR